MMPRRMNKTKTATVIPIATGVVIHAVFVVASVVVVVVVVVIVVVGHGSQLSLQ